MFESVGGAESGGVEITLDRCLEIFSELESEVKGLSQAYLDKEKASQTIMAKLSHN